MSGMNPWLAQMYGTGGTGEAAPPVQNEEQQKIAAAELFCKLAADSGVDLSEYNDEQIQAIYNEVMTKQAADAPPFPPKKEEGKEEEGKEEGKEEEAKEEGKEEEGKEEGSEDKAKMEFAEKKAFAEKFAEADLMGRTMAHSLVDELSEIQKHAEASASTATAEQPKVAAVEAATVTAAAAKMLGQQKTASTTPNIDLEAARYAVKLAAACNFNEEEAVQRLQAVLTLGPTESEKVAGAQDFESARHIRALELLEQAKYPVNWEEVFGAAE